MLLPIPLAYFGSPRASLPLWRGFSDCTPRSQSITPLSGLSPICSTESLHWRRPFAGPEGQEGDQMDPARLTQKSQEALHAAQTRALRLGHTEVDGEHLLLALTDQVDGIVPRLLSQADADPDRLRSALEADCETAQSERPRRRAWPGQRDPAPGAAAGCRGAGGGGSRRIRVRGASSAGPAVGGYRLGRRPDPARRGPH